MTATNTVSVPVASPLAGPSSAGAGAGDLRSAPDVFAPFVASFGVRDLNNGSLGNAIDEARRFLRLAKQMEQEAKGHQFFPAPSKQAAAVKRASMDLSRALSAMRKSG